MLLLLADTPVIYIKVEKPVFDLVGVVLSSLGLAGICAAVALVLGIAFGIGIILRRRRRAESWSETVTLHLQ